MKKILPAFFTFYFLSSIIHHSVSADFENAYQDYLYQYDQYRTSLTNFLTTKNRYLTYKTLVSQTEALTASKVFLESRDQVLTAYLKMLVEKNPQENWQKLLKEEITFFSDHQNQISAVGSLEDVISFSKVAEEHFPMTEVLARQLVASLLLNKVQVFEERLTNLESSFEEKINLIKNQGKEATTLERWFLETKNKQILAHGKLDEAQGLIGKLTPKTSSAQISEDFRKIQVLIFEANQYLKEGASYLKEIKEELKYGNY